MSEKVEAPFVVVAREQNAGKGRLSRKWYAQPDTTLCMSVVIPAPHDSTLIRSFTTRVAVSVCSALEKKLSTQLYIKWPNDIISPEGLKLCGILTKLRTVSGCPEYINAGIGINANTDGFAPELCYATSLKMILGREVDESKIFCNALQNIEACLSMDEAEMLKEYTRRCITAGSRVRVIYAGGSGDFTGLCSAINSDGSLTVQKDDGSLITVNSGEVSVRGVYGENYV